MKCVVDTSSLSWLERIGRLELLNKLYDEIYVPLGVADQLKNYLPLQEFLNKSASIIKLSEQEKRRFSRLVHRWLRKTRWADPVDIEVLIAYRIFGDADEMLFANKNAIEKFRDYGAVRDIINLYELAEAKGIFRREDTLQYLEDLLKVGYRKPYITNLKRKLIM